MHQEIKYAAKNDKVLVLCTADYTYWKGVVSSQLSSPLLPDDVSARHSWNCFLLHGDTIEK